LVGLRDLSTILTPPKSRRPILTSVRYFNWDLIFSTIEFELERGGQTYFLHNDIKSIPIIINKIKNRFKNVKIEGVSGKIPSKELEPIVLSFFSGKIDILVCTTIIESGLDVTNANTIIINNAQDFGLSQLYQIRGRVGRGEKQARCLLLVPQKQLSQDAHLRLKAVEENNALGSGYTLSVKDLEIRGAGSLFGYKQSGNISSVGFELYCEILQDEINLEKNQIEKRQDVIIFGDFLTEIGERYVSNRSIRVDFYFQLSKTKTLSDLLRIKKSLIDRFGNLPVETERLFLFSHIKLIFRDSCINKIYIKDTSFSLTLSDLGVFKTLENLFSLLNSFKSENLNGFHYKKDTKGNLVIVFSVSGVERAFLLLFEIEPFFNDKNIS
jgi:transcription-repair coupling factor (superfamily II helicase)